MKEFVKKHYHLDKRHLKETFFLWFGGTLFFGILGLWTLYEIGVPVSWYYLIPPILIGLLFLHALTHK